MLPSVALLCLIASGSSTTGVALTDPFGRPRPITPRVLVLPTITRGDVESASEIDEERLATFSEALGETTAELLRYRRWIVHAGQPLVDVLGQLRLGDACRSLDCVERLSQHLGATHWISSVLIATGENECRVRSKHFSITGQAVLFDEEKTIAPCGTHDLLTHATDLGQRLAAGPRAPVPIDLDLTSLSVPDLDIPDIPDVARFRVTSSTTARPESGYTLERALEIYGEQRVFVFARDERTYVGRGRESISDCDLFRAASLPVDDDLETHCTGNNWSYAWGALPVGGLFMLAGSDALDGGGSGGEAAMLGLGVITALAAPVLVLLFQKAPALPDEHALSLREIETVVDKVNADLRKSLDLSESDVVTAGYEP